jgi:predicted glutamine amidotransferase
MCIAILNRKDTISKEIFDICHSNNPDGKGFVYAKNGQLVIEKCLSPKIDNFYNKYLEVRKHFNGFIAIHFRIKTSGKVNLENCHPFKVSNKLAFVHNGMLSIPSSKTHSDTFHFCEALKLFGKNDFLENKVIGKMLEEVIDKYNKIIFIKSNGDATIYNKSAGHEHNGDWYSNKTYLYDNYYGCSYDYNWKSVKTKTETKAKDGYDKSWKTKTYDDFVYDKNKKMWIAKDEGDADAYQSDAKLKNAFNLKTKYCYNCESFSEIYGNYCIDCGMDVNDSYDNRNIKLQEVGNV